jgi:tRNA dimethylallyltransferase
MPGKLLIAVVGPTAIGKTALAIELAKHFGSEILSADSRQFYREMSVGTAVPSKAELEMARHHFVQHRSIFDRYSVGDFERDALARLNELYKENNIAVLAGGSGLYVDAVCRGLDDFPPVSMKIRAMLKQRLEQEGLGSLQEQLKVLDPIQYHRTDLANPHRIMRALEICIGTGKPYSGFLEQGSGARPFRTIYIGLEADRETLYAQINARVDRMMDMGLLDEAKKLFEYRHLNALQTVGYKELFRYFEGGCTLPEAVAEIKKNTRRFAKRQLTWFRKNKDIQWVSYLEPAGAAINIIENLPKKQDDGR